MGVVEYFLSGWIHLNSHPVSTVQTTRLSQSVLDMHAVHQHKSGTVVPSLTRFP